MYEERDTQAQHYWQARLARERLTISESVEEILADSSSREQWNGDEQDYNGQADASVSTDFVPPRLSLQSKVLPSVRPATFVQSVTAELAAQQAALQKQEAEQKPPSANILTRLAQRFTSSIAAFGASMQPEVGAAPPPLLEHGPDGEERGLIPHTPSYPMTPVERVQQMQAPLATVIDAIPATPSVQVARPVQSKQRLAGHTSKIHLQNASIPKAAPQRKEKKAPESSREHPETGRELPREPRREVMQEAPREPLREPLIINVRAREKVQETTYSDMPILTPLTREETQRVQPDRAAQIGKNAPANREAHYTPCFGMGAFESGQSEIMVRNTRAMESSVVQVILTSNPGPTLVQYISLHPELGFTLHLTAPVAKKTTFNYVLFIDTL